MSITRTIDEKDIQVGVGLIIRKLRELNRESHASEPAMSQERAAEVYKKISSILKNMAETELFTKEEMQKYSDDWMKGNKYPYTRPIEFVFVINDIFEKAAWFAKTHQEIGAFSMYLPFLGACAIIKIK